MRVLRRIGIAAGVLACLGGAAAAQETSTTSTETRQFEVVAVDGNDLVVKTAEGTRQLTVRDDFRFTVDGRPVSVQELKPGMTGTATITTRTTMTPVTVTEVKNGTVAQVTSSTIAVRTDEGIRAFSQSDIDKRGVKILRDGKPAQLADFRPGDYLTATIVTTMPPATLTERELEAALSAPPVSVRTPDVSLPEPIVAPPSATPAPAPVGTTGSAGQEGAPAPATLPNTAGQMPLIGAIGLAALVVGAALAGRRLRRS
jgi:hypothetical protein